MPGKVQQAARDDMTIMTGSQVAKYLRMSCSHRQSVALS
jgi:hypothetical protein